PTHLVFAVLPAGAVIAGVAVGRMPETSARRAGAFASLKPILGIPARLRADVLALVPIIIASWALGGLYLSLGPSVAASLFGLSNHLIGGFVVTLLCGAGAATAFVLRSRPTSRILGIKRHHAVSWNSIDARRRGSPHGGAGRHRDRRGGRRFRCIRPRL